LALCPVSSRYTKRKVGVHSTKFVLLSRTYGRGNIKQCCSPPVRPSVCPSVSCP